MKRNNINLLIAVFLVLIAASARVVNQGLNLHNFVPIASIALFSGAIFREKRSWALLIPLLGQFLADVYFQAFTYVPGFYAVTDQLFTYGAILGAAALGLTLVKKKPLAIFGYTLGASAIFFIVSNFGYFADGWNGYSLQGFVKTYVDAVPFYRNSFVADMVGSLLLFGGYFATQRALLSNAQKANV